MLKNIEKRLRMKKTWITLVCLLSLICLVFSASAETVSPLIPDIAAFADQRLTQDSASGTSMYYSGNWLDIRNTVTGYFELIKSQYHLKEDGHFQLVYSHNDQQYDYFVYFFSYNASEGDTIPNTSFGTKQWNVSGSDVVICYSQGRPEADILHFSYSTGFSLQDMGERLDTDALSLPANTFPLPDLMAYSDGLLEYSKAIYRQGGFQKFSYTGSTKNVEEIMNSYVQLLTTSYNMEQIERVEWEKTQKHITYGFRYAGEGADNLSVMGLHDDENGIHISGANVILYYTLMDENSAWLEIEFFGQNFALQKTGEVLKVVNK